MNSCFMDYDLNFGLESTLGFFGYCETRGQTIAGAMNHQGVSSCFSWLSKGVAECKQFFRQAEDTYHQALLGKYVGGYDFTYSDGSQGVAPTRCLLLIPISERVVLVDT